MSVLAGLVDYLKVKDEREYEKEREASLRSWQEKQAERQYGYQVDLFERGEAAQSIRDEATREFQTSTATTAYERSVDLNDQNHLNELERQQLSGEIDKEKLMMQLSHQWSMMEAGAEADAKAAEIARRFNWDLEEFKQASQSALQETRLEAEKERQQDAFAQERSMFRLETLTDAALTVGQAMRGTFNTLTEDQKSKADEAMRWLDSRLEGVTDQEKAEKILEAFASDPLAAVRLKAKVVAREDEEGAFGTGDRFLELANIFFNSKDEDEDIAFLSLEEILGLDADNMSDEEFLERVSELGEGQRYRPSSGVFTDETKNALGDIDTPVLQAQFDVFNTQVLALARKAYEGGDTPINKAKLLAAIQNFSASDPDATTTLYSMFGKQALENLVASDSRLAQGIEGNVEILSVLGLLGE